MKTAIDNAYQIALEFGLKDATDAEKRAYFNLLKQISRDSVDEFRKLISNIEFNLRDQINNLKL